MSAKGIGDVEHDISIVRRTKPRAQSRATLVERVERIDIVLLINSLTLSLPPTSLDGCNWVWRAAVMDSTEWQFSSCKVIGCSGNDMPVFFSYVCRADSNSAGQRVDLDWSLIVSQVEMKCSPKKGSWLCVTK